MSKDRDENWFFWLCEERKVSPWAEMAKFRKSGSGYQNLRKELSSPVKLIIDAKRHFGISWDKLGKLLEKQYDMEQE